MTEPTFDADGYPTDETLDVIRLWPLGEWKGLIEFARRAWKYGEFVTESVPKDGKKRYVFVTGGWSGNEDIIGAMKQNQMFWIMCWYSSTRGGRHEFEVQEWPARTLTNLPPMR